MGIISSRPFEEDRSVYPPKGSYLDRTGPASIFKEVRAVKTGEIPADADLVLHSELSLSSEVIEVLDTPPSRVMIDGQNYPMKGDYFLYLLGSYRFSLVDARTGTIIANEKTKAEYIDAPMLSKYIKIPADNGDAAAYAKYFRTVDFEPQAEETVRVAFESIMPLLAPYYVNTYHAVKIEK